MNLVQWIERVYVYIFYVFVKSFINEWWAVTVMTVVESAVIMGLVCGVFLITGHTPMSIPTAATLIGYLVIYAITLFVLMRKHRWRRYEAEFKQYSKTKSSWASIAVWSGVVLSFMAALDIVKTAIGAATF